MCAALRREPQFENDAPPSVLLEVLSTLRLVLIKASPVPAQLLGGLVSALVALASPPSSQSLPHKHGKAASKREVLAVRGEALGLLRLMLLKPKVGLSRCFETPEQVRNSDHNSATRAPLLLGERHMHPERGSQNLRPYYDNQSPPCNAQPS